MSDVEPLATPALGCGPMHARSSLHSVPLRKQVFDCVRSAGRIPRVDVAKALGVSPATVTSLVAELLQTGLLNEVAAPEGERTATRGRPPVALSVRAEAGYVAGIKLNDDAHTGVITDFSGALVAEATLRRTVMSNELDNVLEEAAKLLNILLGKAGLKRSALLGLGLGVPGTVDFATGSLYWSPIIAERDINLRDLASGSLGVPVEIDNDANLLTLAELWYGAGRSKSDFAVVTIEQGVGMGFVVDNRLYRGAHGTGMELGHIKVQLDGALCRCGQRGCLEAYVADYALVREAAVALNMPQARAQAAQVTLENLFEHAKAGNEAARMIFRRAGRFLAVALSNVSNLLDPSLIILSGERMQYDYLYAEDVLNEMRRLTISNGRGPQEVRINTWGAHVWARGAATLALSVATEEMTGGSMAAA